MQVFKRKPLTSQQLSRRSTIAVIACAALLIVGLWGFQYWSASKGIRLEVEQRAKAELKVKQLEIQKVLSSVEVAMQNMDWAIERGLSDPDAFYEVAERLVSTNEAIVGAAALFVPNFYPQKGRWYEPYVTTDSTGQFVHKQIGSASHDYLQFDWYLKGLASPNGYWSEPYYDEAGALQMLSSYTQQIRDREGRVVGIFVADVSLEWLGKIMNAKPLYPSSYNIMLSRSGQIMASPIETLVLRHTIEEVTAKMSDTAVKSLNINMKAGQSGTATIVNNKGEKNYVFYAPVEGNTGWSMAVVCPDREVYADLRATTMSLLLPMLLGMLLLGFIVWRTVRSARHLREMGEQRASMESELRVANNIQMAMLPKIFPPYPDRDDVDIYGLLLPAKAVGGDLFDFYIRDEKLFFCIGDVSGKGVPASLLMAVTRALFRTVSAHEAHPAHIMTLLNDTIAQDNESNMFVTLFVGVLDLPTGRLRYCNAGHDAPLLAGEHVGQLPCDPNLPVGVMPDWKFTAQEAIIYTDTTIFLYTDGLTEAENAAHELFGDERIKKVATLAEHRPHRFVHAMADAAKQFVGDAEQSDDLTMLAIHYTKQQLDIRFSSIIILKNDVQEVPKLATFVDQVCERLSFDPATTMQMNLAIEEAVVNVMNYAYPAGTEGDVKIEAQANDQRLKFVIIDSGMPFDPTAQEDADITLSAEERRIGGLGIYLVRQLMDSINYERVDGQNVLTLRKKL